VGFCSGFPYSKVVHVSEEGVDLDDLLNRRAGLLENGLEVTDACSSLLLDGSLDQVTLRVTGDLAGAVDGSGGLDGLGLDGNFPLIKRFSDQPDPSKHT